MTAPFALTTRDWISLPAAAIRKLGGEPADRIHYTGHAVQLPRPYLPSIGNWARLEVEDLIDAKAPHKGLMPVRWGAFRQFKSARGLLTGREFEALYGRIADGPWIHAELSWVMVDRAQRAFVRTTGVEASLGVCASRIAKRAMRPEVRKIGLLPVEIVLYARVFDVFLGHHLLRYDEWHAFRQAEKLAFWSAGRAGQHWSLEHCANVPARRDLPFSAGLREPVQRAG